MGSEEFDVNKILEAHDKELMEGLDEVDEMDFVQMDSNSQSEGKVDVSGRVLDFLTMYHDEEDEENENDLMDEDAGGLEENGAAKNSSMEEAADFDFGEE